MFGKTGNQICGIHITIFIKSAIRADFSRRKVDTVLDLEHFVSLVEVGILCFYFYLKGSSDVITC